MGLLIDRQRHGPWALVTGASDGIGRAFAHELLHAGLDLIVAGRRAEALEAHQRDAALLRRGCIPVIADLATAEGVSRVLEATSGRDVGLAVCAAGFGTSGPATANPIDEELAMVDVNCRAVLAIALPLAARMQQRGRGGLVLMSSLLAFQGVPRSANYAATKAYVQALAEGLRGELAPDGIDVLAVAPGPVASGFGARARMRMTLTDDPRRVAREALGRLRGGGTVRPGRLGKLLEASLAPLPRRARSAILARVMAGMTRREGTT